MTLSSMIWRSLLQTRAMPGKSIVSVSGAEAFAKSG